VSNRNGTVALAYRGRVRMVWDLAADQIASASSSNAAARRRHSRRASTRPDRPSVGQYRHGVPASLQIPAATSHCGCPELQRWFL